MSYSKNEIEVKKVLDGEYIEPIIYKLAMTDAKYSNLLLNTFKKSWFTDGELGSVLDVAMKYYASESNIPTPATMELIVSRVYSDDTRVGVISKVRNALAIDVDAYNPEFLEKSVLEYIKNNAIFQVICAYMENMQATQMVSCMEDIIDIAGLTFDTNLGLSYFDDLDIHLLELDNPEERASTGWATMDEATNGGFYKDGRCLITFMAETGMGKSLIMSNIAASYVKMGKFPLVISLEMAEHVYAQRIDGHLSGISVNDLKYRTEDLKASILKIKESQPTADLVIKEFPPETVDSNSIKNYIEDVVRSKGRKPDIILVDYINLVLPNGGASKNDNSYSKIGKTTRDLRTLSYIFNCPVVSATQSNRGGYGAAVPSIENVSESMGIAHVSDFIGALYQNEGDRDAGLIRMISLKNRLAGVVGKTLTFDIDYNNLIISDSDESFDSVSNAELESVFASADVQFENNIMVR
jgi:replicative DNA helicase